MAGAAAEVRVIRPAVRLRTAFAAAFGVRLDFPLDEDGSAFRLACDVLNLVAANFPVKNSRARTSASSWLKEIELHLGRSVSAANMCSDNHSESGLGEARKHRRQREWTHDIRVGGSVHLRIR